MDLTVGSILVVLGGIAGVFTTYLNLKDRFKQKIVADVQPLIVALESRVALAEKEIDHMKKTHSSEIATLAKKVDELRDEIRLGHTQLIDLLMKFVPDSKRK